MRTLLCGLVLGLLAVGSAHANPDDDIRLGQPNYSGTGCPGGSASAAISPDGKELSILFDRFIVESGSSGTKRKACNVSIPVHVPNGYSISILAVDYRGFVDIPAGLSALLRNDYYFGGSRAVTFSRSFRDGTTDNYTFTNRLEATATVWSKCGGEIDLNTQTSMEVANPMRLSSKATATVDSMDLSAGIVYRLNWKKCGGDTPPPPPPVDPAEPARDVIGVVDEVIAQGNQAIVRGWACSQSSAKPIDVHLYVGGPAGQGQVVGGYPANQPSEEAVEDRCASGGDHHRFSILLTAEQVRAHAGKPVYVHGISNFGLSNFFIERSGQLTIPVPQAPPVPQGPEIFPEGLFMVGPGVLYSNGVNAFCGYVSWHHFVASTGRNDVNGVRSYTHTPSGMANHGACAIPKMPEGLFTSNGTVYYSNGQDAFCGFTSPEHLGRHGITNLNGVLEYPSVPVHMRNDGACGG